MPPGVSFVCPVYNKERYLPGVIEHLRDQARGRPRQFIFVDDGSRDASMRIVRELTRDWPDCIYIEQANAGPAAATNAGLAVARLDYIKLLGSDDLLPPGATDWLIEVMEATGADAVFGRMRYYRDPPDLAAVPATWKGVTPRLVADPLPPTVAHGWSGTSQTLYRRATVERAGRCDPRVFVEDYSLALRVARIGRFALLDADLAFGPAADDGRIMLGLKHQTMHDYGLALYHFFRDFPELAPRLGPIAFRRAAGRAYKWARREGRHGFPWRYFLLNLLSRVPGAMDPVEGLLASLGAYAEGPYADARALIYPQPLPPLPRGLLAGGRRHEPARGPA